MCTVSVRRFFPFFATNGCRRLFTSTRPTSSPRNHDTIRAVERRSAQESRDLAIQPGSKGFLNRRGDEGKVDDLRTLKGLLYPGTEPIVAKYIPLDAAAAVVAILQSIPTGLATPPEVTTKVLKIAERADPTFLPWRLEALFHLAMSLTRPGENSDSEHNGELIARLLHITVSNSAHTPYRRAVNRLVGVLYTRTGCDPILLTDYSVDARADYARFISSCDVRFSWSQITRTACLLRREVNPCKKEALLQSYMEGLEAGYSQRSDIKGRICASSTLAKVYSDGDILPRDGQLAKLWWERVLCVGLSTCGFKYRLVCSAAGTLGRHYLSKQDTNHRLWAPDFTKGFRCLHLAKWGEPDAAHLLGSLYYLDHESDHCRTIKDHISFHGVIPDDTLAAEAFCIGAERLGDEPSKYKLATMLYLGRAHPPVNPTAITKYAFTPQLPQLPEGTRLPPDDDWTSEELEKVLELFNDDSVIKLAPRSRRETLDYAWKLVEPSARAERVTALTSNLAALRELIRDEMRQYQE